jgi:hypothetical protein
MARATSRQKDRVSDDPGASAIIASALTRQAKKKAAAKEAAKRGKARGNKPIHAVDNTPHMQNNSSRQVDGVDTIDRDADVATQWRRPSNLDAPDPRPGYVQRWVRYRSGNVEDTENLEKAMDQGWRPRERTTEKRGHELTAKTSGTYGKYYVKRGLMLMEMPLKLAQQRNAFYEKKLQQMTKSVDVEMMRENNTVMPLLAPERKTRTTRAAKRGSLEASIPDDDE